MSPPHADELPQTPSNKRKYLDPIVEGAAEGARKARRVFGGVSRMILADALDGTGIAPNQAEPKEVHRVVPDPEEARKQINAAINSVNKAAYENMLKRSEGDSRAHAVANLGAAELGPIVRIDSLAGAAEYAAAYKAAGGKVVDAKPQSPALLPEAFGGLELDSDVLTPEKFKRMTISAHKRANFDGLNVFMLPPLCDSPEHAQRQGWYLHGDKWLGGPHRLDTERRQLWSVEERKPVDEQKPLGPLAEYAMACTPPPVSSLLYQKRDLEEDEKQEASKAGKKQRVWDNAAMTQEKLQQQKLAAKMKADMDAEKKEIITEQARLWMKAKEAAARAQKEAAAEAATDIAAAEEAEGWTKARIADLKDIRRATPTNLYRVYCPHSGGNAINDCSLNCKHRMVPHAYASKETQFFKGGGPRRLYDVPVPKLREIVSNHLRGQRHRDTIFTSWTPSFAFALAYANYFRSLGRDDIRIAILDREQYDAAHGGKLHFEAYNVPDLCRLIGPPDLRSDTYSFEYPAFGVISGYKSVGFQDLLLAGIRSHLALWCTTYWKVAGVGRTRANHEDHDREFKKSASIEPRVSKEVARSFKGLALVCGEEVAAAVTVAFICRAHRVQRTTNGPSQWSGADFKGAFDESDVKNIVEVLAEEPAVIFPAFVMPDHEYAFEKTRAWTGRLPDFGQYIYLSERVRDAQWSRGRRVSRAETAQKLKEEKQAKEIATHSTFRRLAYHDWWSWGDTDCDCDPRPRPTPQE